MDPRLHLAVDQAGNRQQLDAIAQLGRVQDVTLRNLGDPLTPDLFGHDRRAECQRGQDGQLVGRVPRLDVIGGVGLGIAKLLRFAKRVGERSTAFSHARQDVVGGAVNDAHHAGDLVGRKIQLKRANERDAAADAGFVSDADASGGRRGQDGWPMFGHDLLVGGDHVFAALDCLEDQRASWLLAADHFDDDVHCWIVEDRPRIGDQRHLQANAARLGRIAHQHAGDLHGPTDAPLERIPLAEQHPRDPSAYGAQAE